MFKLGICMEGGEKEFLNAVEAGMKRFDNPLYVEIGVAQGDTIKAVHEAVREIPMAKVTGIELPESPFWPVLNRLGMPIIAGRSVEVLSDPMFGIISVAFIDACHGKACVMADFLAVEKHCVSDSIVIFHDAGINEQGSSMQPHCGEPINVRAALFELGLLNRVRPGWTFEGVIPTANQCAVFRHL